MTIFGEDKVRTSGEVLDSALECATPEEARRWLEQEIAIHVEAFGKDPAKAEDVIRENLVYGASRFYDHDRSASDLIALLFTPLERIYAHG